MSQRKYLTQSEVERLLQQALAGGNAERDYCLIYMSFIHGFRVSEVCHLRLSDLDLRGHSLYIRRIKSGFSTSHPLLKDELRAIRAWLAVRAGLPGADSDWVFLSRQGNALTRQRVYQIISQLGQAADISVVPHPHMLRHACGFALADRGIDTRLIQDYLGHKNIRHTVRYTASNAERFEGVWHRPKNKRKSRQLGPNCKVVYATR
ncbi:tyrosine-type DNA invertase [Serratia marcescens]|uniref:Tyrosine recombinase XerC n=3 Tax=Serratia marcescens TaxID=615 RepID=A0A379Y319_SERMA|nr:tyrosine-type DNA invertase [Serratia marcescens]KFD16572.1 FimB family type 1 fimbrial regulatory protein [Serratia marcescens subsp. marcescens ATCC 13880]KFL05678.1 phage integrase family protein [Serratia marcescens]MCC3252222.1 tyrosine-type recombinase/integrase [Serratia marcescens]PNU42650.1 DNA recombinase [Serratia marcescens subsp. marcescens ATCC 13880]QDL84720.1 DNA recombinase [Serratia marcescens subsp. marcescens ATCC 13880]